MSERSLIKGKFNKRLGYASVGVLDSLDGYNVYGENILRVTADIELNGVIVVQARIEAEEEWSDILTITGDGTKQSQVVFIDTWDFIRVKCTNFIATGTYIYLSGFYSGGSVAGEISPSGLKIGGRITEVTLNDTTWTALPIVALADRNAICIQNRSGKEIKINYRNDVGYEGIIIDNRGERFYDITENIIIYAISSSGTAVVTIEEIA